MAAINNSLHSEGFNKVIPPHSIVHRRQSSICLSHPNLLAVKAGPLSVKRTLQEVDSELSDTFPAVCIKITSVSLDFLSSACERRHLRTVSFSDTITAKTFNHDSPPSRDRKRRRTHHSSIHLVTPPTLVRRGTKQESLSTLWKRSKARVVPVPHNELPNLAPRSILKMPVKVDSLESNDAPMTESGYVSMETMDKSAMPDTAATLNVLDLARQFGDLSTSTSQG